MPTDALVIVINQARKPKGIIETWLMWTESINLFVVRI